MPPEPLSTLEYHVLLALAEQPLYGYAIKEAVTEESGGVLQPRAGSLYRVLARLMVRGMVAEAASKAAAAPHPGLERRYYALSAAGRTALREEASRRREAALLAQRRLGLASRRSR